MSEFNFQNGLQIETEGLSATDLKSLVDAIMLSETNVRIGSDGMVINHFTVEDCFIQLMTSVRGHVPSEERSTLEDQLTFLKGRAELAPPIELGKGQSILEEHFPIENGKHKLTISEPEELGRVEIIDLLKYLAKVPKITGELFISADR